MRKPLSQWLLGAGLFILGAASATAQVQQITLTRIGPTVEVTDTSGERPTFEATNNGTEVYEEDLIVTIGEGSRVILVFSNGATINVGQDSQVEIRQFAQDPFSSDYAFGEATTEPPTSNSQTRIHLTRGELIGNVKSLNEGSTFEVSTPAGAAGIRGTTFRVVFRPSDDGGAFFTVTTIEGDVLVSTLDGTLADAPISVTDQQEIEILVEVNDETGEVTVLTPTSEITTTTAAPETVAAVTEVVQQAAEEVAAIVLDAIAPSGPSGDGENTGQGNPEEGDEDTPGQDQQGEQKDGDPLPQSETDQGSQFQGGAG